MVTVKELNEIRRQAGYARYLHTNLHMHTPATPWDWNAYNNQTYRAHEITPELYFEYLNRTSLDLVAITDHNCVDWCTPLIRLAREGRKNGTSKLYILPGVEITTYEGPHILAIFDENTNIDDLRNMLIRLDMSGKGEESDKIGCRAKKQQTIQDLFNIVVDELHGIVIAPHVHNKDGLWGPKEFRGREQVLNDPRLRILATKSGDIKRVPESDGRVRFLYKTMDSTRITNSFAFINVSDCHRVDDFVKDTTWIKMCSPSLEGVRQIIYEPELRICHRLVGTSSGHQYSEALSFTEPESSTHPHLISIAISGGMLDNQIIAFSPHQNSIIGKNYSGKSSVLDCIRFVMNELPPDEEGRSKLVARLRGIIGEGGEVRAYLHQDGNILGASRVLSCSKVGSKAKERWQLDGTTSTFRLFNDVFHPEIGKTINSIMGLEVYPQGEVVRVKDNVSQQMRIVDSLAKLDEQIQQLTAEEMKGTLTLRGKILQNGRQIVEIHQQIEQMATEVSVIPDLEAEVTRLATLADSPLLNNLAEWGDARSQIGGLQQGLTSALEEITATLPTGEEQDTADGSDTSSADGDDDPLNVAKNDDDPDSPAGTLRNAGRIHISAKEKAYQLVLSAIDELRLGVAELQKLIVETTTQYDQVKQSVQEALGASSSENAQIVLLERIEQKRTELRKLQAREQTLESLRTKGQELDAQRVQLLVEYMAAWAQIRQQRRSVVDLINQDSSDNIQAGLVESIETDEFKYVVESIADSLTSAANRISNKQAQLTLIVDALSPAQFLVYVKKGNVLELVNAVPGLTENTARILIGMGLADIHRSELCVYHDRFVVKYRREGETTFTPIDAGLSGGEQALALISVAMVRKPLPLIIDQPEDELGQALITKDLVESIRKVKPHRQLIFVTHVPNIPVLADSEQVVYMQQVRNDDSANLIVQHTGSLDCLEIIQRLLELDGGRLAMEKRYERYTPLFGRH